MTRTVLVTGGSSGIGRETCKRFHEEGYQVAVLDNQEKPREGGTPTHQLIQQDGGTATFVQADVTDREKIDRALEMVRARMGMIDVVVNNAGIAETAPIGEMDVETFDAIMQVNVYGVFHCVQSALEHLAEDASIINVASVAGKEGSPGLAAYCGSKAAVIRFTDAVAKELDDVTVNAVCPRRTKTAMTDFEGDPPEKVAEIIYETSQAETTGEAVDVV